MISIKRLILAYGVSLAILAGCSNPQTFEDYFKAQMEDLENEYDEKVDYSYSLIYQEQNVVHNNDAIAIYTENNLQGEQIFIAYFERTKNNWERKQTRGAEWNTPVRWSSMQNEPYIYSGALIDESIREVYAGHEKAKIIELGDGKRFWFAISSRKEVEVKTIKEDGSQEIIDELDREMLMNWKGKDE